MKLVGITGALGCGKSTAAEVMVDRHGYRRMSMAEPIKNGLIGMGATWEEVYVNKMEPNALWGGKTNRFAMQTLGTEWGRRMVTPDIWVNCMARQLQAALADPTVPGVVIDDIRFRNEARMIHDMGGTLWAVRRRSVEFARWKQRVLRVLGWWSGALIGVHGSERGWVVIEPDHVLHNNGSIEAFKALVELELRIPAL